MDKVTMLARTRTMLDEATSVLYNDTTELYPALSQAQTEVCRVVANGWFNGGKKAGAPIPMTIQGVFAVAFDSLSTANFSFVLTDMIVPVSLEWNPSGSSSTDGEYCTETTGTGEMQKFLKNSLLSGGFYMWWDGARVYMNPISAHSTAGYYFEYIKEPVDITASINPESGAVCHDAIVERALWILLKDRETEQAQLHLQLYGSLLEGLMA